MGRSWRMVEKLLGVLKGTCTGLLKGVRNGGLGQLLDGDYFRVPVLVEGQEVLRFYDGFLGNLKRCRDIKGMERLMGETWNGLGMGHLKRFECSHGEFSGEVAWNFGCRHVMDFSGPGDLVLSSVAAIYGLGQWFTEGHIENTGDESVAALGFGKKVFFYAKTARSGRWFIQSVRSTGAFQDLVCRGRQEKLWESIVNCIWWGI